MIIMDSHLWIGVNYSIYVWIKIIYLNIFNILASIKGHLKIVKLLCQNNAEVNHKGYNRDTALILGI